MKKRIKAQISVFVILAIILVATGILTFYTVKSSSKNIFSQPEIKAKVSSILSSINNCEEISADSSVMRISWQGGYRNPPKNYLDLGWTFIPYYFFQEQTYLPEKSTIEKYPQIQQNYPFPIEVKTQRNEYNIYYLPGIIGLRKAIPGALANAEAMRYEKESQYQYYQSKGRLP